ncbi:MAG: class I SAM-dependent methyltransferase [Nocardioidaceae bacterium]
MNVVHRRYCRSRWWCRHLQELLPWAIQEAPLSGATVLELGSGPGQTTDWLRSRVGVLTAVEYNRADATALATRAAEVRVVNADATALPFPDATFDAVVCFTMLHHVPTVELQNQLFGEAHRVLRSRGVFAGSDSRWGPLFALAHIGDTMQLVDPTTIEDRLRDAGFDTATTERRRSTFRFHATA